MPVDPLSFRIVIPYLRERCIQGYKFLKDVKNAPKACSELMEELELAQARLEQLQEHLSRVEDKERAQLPLQNNEKTLDKLDSILKVYRDPNFKFNLLKHAKWAWSGEKEIKALCNDLKQNSGNLQTFLIQMTRDIVNERQQKSDAEKATRMELAKRLQNIVIWLEPLNSEAKLREVLEHRQPGTCEWLLSHELFTSWYSSGSFLWLNGIPGNGKTVLASFVIDHLKKRVTNNQIVLFAFADFQDARSTEVVVLLRTLLAQILERYKPENFVKDFGELETLMQLHHADLPKSVDYLIQLLRKANVPWKRVFIVIDALDECMQKSRRKSIAAIQKLAPAGSNISVFVTSRAEQDIIEILSGVPTIYLANEAQSVKNDIKRFIEDKMKTYLLLARLHEPFRTYITSTLLEKSKGMFRLVDCQLYSLAKAKFTSDINEILQNLPEDLNSMYERILQSVEGEGREAVKIVQRTLWWLVGSHRQLRVAELMEAVMVETRRDSPNVDLAPLSGEHLLEMCSSLVRHNTEGDFLTLSHASVQDFLLSDYLKATVYHDCYIPSTPFLQRHITGLIVAYLQYADFQTGPCQTRALLSQRLERHPLLIYIASYWDWHIVRMDDEATSAEQPSDQEVLDLFFDARFLPIQRSLRQVAYFGADIDAQDASCEFDVISGFSGPTNCLGPSWLAQSQHNYQLLKQSPPRIPSLAEENYMVYPLLLQGPIWLVQKIMRRQPELKDRPIFDYGTPLMICASTSMIDMMKMLLEEGANANKCAPHCRVDDLIVPPIHLAIKQATDNVQAVKMLLSHGSNTVFSGQQPDDSIAYTIIAAAEYGRADILKVLIDHGVDVNTRSLYSGCTAIHAAVASGSIDCIILLGNAGHHINSRFEGRTPLQVALELQSSTIVQFLLSRGASPWECWYLSLDSMQWALEKDWYPEVETCLAQLERERLIEADRSQGVVEEVVCILKLKFRLPNLLIRRIFDFAEFWIAATSERQEEIVINQHSRIEPYISTPPINYKLENPIRRIVFRISSHDQGWSSDGNTPGVYSGSLTWFEADVDSARGTRREILRNARADFRSRTHTRVWDYQDEFSTSDMWMANIKSGDSISVYPRALRGGWVNYVESMTVIVFTAFI